MYPPEQSHTEGGGTDKDRINIWYGIGEYNETICNVKKSMTKRAYTIIIISIAIGPLCIVLQNDEYRLVLRGQ